MEVGDKVYCIYTAGSRRGERREGGVIVKVAEEGETSYPYHVFFGEPCAYRRLSRARSVNDRIRYHELSDSFNEEEVHLASTS